MTQTNGWQRQALRTTHNARINRTKLAAKLKAERVAGSEHTPAELEAIHRQLKADYLAREAQRKDRSMSADCPGCGAPDGYLPAGPCLDHGATNAVADVPGVTSCVDCGRRLFSNGDCPECDAVEDSNDPYDY